MPDRACNTLCEPIFRRAESAVARVVEPERSALVQVGPAKLAEQAARTDGAAYFEAEFSNLALLGEVLCQTPHGLFETRSYSDPNFAPALEAS
jgi:hypothetical protein